MSVVGYDNSPVSQLASVDLTTVSQEPDRQAMLAVQAAVDQAGVDEGMALVSAMHITAGVWVNDDEPGLHEDVLEWLDKEYRALSRENGNVARAAGRGVC